MATINVEEEEYLQEIEENLQRLTMGILEISIDGLPRRYQRHTIGVFGHFRMLIH